MKKKILFLSAMIAGLSGFSQTWNTSAGNIFYPKTSGGATSPFYVGIGLANPYSALQVNSGTGDNHIVASGNAPSVRFQLPSSYLAGDQATPGTPYAKIGLATQVNHFSQGSISGDLILQTMTNSNSIIFSNKFTTSGNTNGVEQMRLNSLGNLGIGTASPNNRVEITHGTSGNSGLRFTNLTSANAPIANPGGNKVLSVNASGDVVLVQDQNTPYTANQGVTLSGTVFQLGDDCGKGGGGFVNNREVNMFGRNLYFNTNDAGKIYIGMNACPALTTRLEIGAQGLTGAVNDYNSSAPSLSGLRFSNLTKDNIPIPNQTKGVLSLDKDGDVIWVEDQTGPGGVAGWLLTGNSTIATDYIGTNNNNDFVIKTNGVQRGKYTANGNFDFGVNNTHIGANTSFTSGTNNSVNTSPNSFAAGYGNTIDGSSSSVGNENNVAMGENNSILASTECATIGGRNSINGSWECVTAGELNIVKDSHGSFLGGGHNNTDGWYNNIVGTANGITGQSNNIIGWSNHIGGSGNFNLLAGENNTVNSGNFIHILGSGITNDLSNSIALGISGNKTVVITDRGMDIQVNPTSPTPAPTHNLTVNADPGSTGVASNIAFLNLPQKAGLPAVLIDPSTGELFMSTDVYNKSAPAATADVRIEKMEQAIKDQQKQIEELKAMIASKDNTRTTAAEFEAIAKINVELSDKNVIVLGQNTPNPFNKSTAIAFNLPKTIQHAVINFTSADGRSLKSVEVTARGTGVINVYANELSSGVYMYTLVADGKVVETKKMQIVR
jgi:hypothetical protein